MRLQFILSDWLARRCYWYFVFSSFTKGMHCCFFSMCDISFRLSVRTSYSFINATSFVCNSLFVRFSPLSNNFWTQNVVCACVVHIFSLKIESSVWLGISYLSGSSIIKSNLCFFSGRSELCSGQRFCNTKRAHYSTCPMEMLIFLLFLFFLTARRNVL